MNAPASDAAMGVRADRFSIAAAQPIHVVYGGAHLFGATTLAKVGALAKASFDTYAPDARAFADALGLSLADDAAAALHARVAAKLARAPVEDYRVDFEDGYGQRADEEEDAHVDSVADALATLFGDAASEARGGKSLALPRLGIRIKAFAPETRRRALSTLERFFTRFGAYASARASSSSSSSSSQRASALAHFTVTLPKVRAAAEVEALATMLDALEPAAGLSPRAVAIEIMVETPDALFAGDGGAALPRLVRAANGRCSGAHLGSYDLLASLGVAAHEQRLTHPACDFAKLVMQTTLAGAGVALSDGATTTMPIAPHREKSGAPLSDAERRENTRAVHAAWRVHAGNVRHGLAQGIYQGWDLHPAQIPARLGAVFAFFGEAAPAMEARLAAFLDRAARASRVGQAFDDAATGEGLLNFFARGVRTGALDESVLARLGLPEDASKARDASAWRLDRLVLGRPAAP